jgi:hypothetical protein
LYIFVVGELFMVCACPVVMCWPPSREDCHKFVPCPDELRLRRVSTLKLGGHYFSGFAVAFVRAFLRRKFFLRRANSHGQQALHADRFDLSVATIHTLELRAA